MVVAALEVVAWGLADLARKTVGRADKREAVGRADRRKAVGRADEREAVPAG